MFTIILTTQLGDGLRELISKLELSQSVTTLLYNLVVIATTIAVAIGLFYVANYLLTCVTKTIARKYRGELVGTLHQNKVLKKISYYLPLIIIYHSLSLYLIESQDIIKIIQRVYNISLVILFVTIANSILKSFVEIFQYKKQNRSKPIKGLVQFLQIIIYFFAFIICLSILVSKQPSTLIAGLGAASAIIMLIFKDSITGLVAGIQISFNNMIKIGDWIEVPKYNVDGEVIDITITSVKVQNWDKTISTIPAYNLVVNDSVKNWEGMSKSGGRRVARSIFIDMQSVKFCTQEMLERFKKFQYISDYVDKTETEIEEYNKEHNVDNSELVNGRRQTNLGVFRAYMVAYLKNKKEVNPDMTLMVRQLQPTENGIPIQIYCFTATTVWAKYEDIQSDIFDHMLAVLPLFDLDIYQSPTGNFNKYTQS
ncbi:MAG: mechanosensitive ion channel family protein [Prevotellaceae bacterium]|nr:mechanosensitive ion channel family protein [Prevotellaceae bacterium]